MDDTAVKLFQREAQAQEAEIALKAAETALAYAKAESEANLKQQEIDNKNETTGS